MPRAAVLHISSTNSSSNKISTMVWFVPVALFGVTTVLYGFSSVLKSWNTNHDNNRQDLYMAFMMLNERVMSMQQNFNQQLLLIGIACALCFLVLFFLMGFLVNDYICRKFRNPWYPSGQDRMQGMNEGLMQHAIPRNYIEEFENRDDMGNNTRIVQRGFVYRRGMERDTRQLQRERKYREGMEGNTRPFQREPENKDGMERDTRPLQRERDYWEGMESDTHPLQRQREFRDGKERDFRTVQKHWEEHDTPFPRKIRSKRIILELQERDQINLAAGLSLSLQNMNEKQTSHTKARSNTEEFEHREEIENSKIQSRMRNQHRLELEELEDTDMAIALSLSEMNDYDINQKDAQVTDYSEGFKCTNNYLQDVDNDDIAGTQQEDATDFYPEELSQAIAPSLSNDV